MVLFVRIVEHGDVVGDPRAVHQHIDSPVLRYDGVRGAIHGAGIGNVESVEGSAITGLAQLPRRLVAVGIVDLGNHSYGARLTKWAGDLQADSPAGSGDYGNAVPGTEFLKEHYEYLPQDSN